MIAKEGDDMEEDIVSIESSQERDDRKQRKTKTGLQATEDKDLVQNGKWQYLDPDDDEDDFKVPSASPTAVATSQLNDFTDDFQHSQQQSIGWDDDLCRPIYYHHSDVVVSSEGDDDTENEILENDGSNYNDREVKGEETQQENDGCNITQATPVRFVSVPQKPRKKQQRTYSDRNAVRRPFSLILSQEEQCLSPELEQVSSEDSDIDKEGNDENKPVAKRRYSTVKEFTYKMESLACPPSNTNSPVFTPTKARRVSTSPDAAAVSCRPGLNNSSGNDQDIFAFDSKATTSHAKKKARLEKSLNRERTFFEELDKTQKLTVEGAASSPPSPVLHEPVIVPRAAKFVFRPNLRNIKS